VAHIVTAFEEENFRIGPIKLAMQASMPAVLVTWPIATQESPFLPQRWPKQPPVFIAPLRGVEKLRDDVPARGGHRYQY